MKLIVFPAFALAAVLSVSMLGCSGDAGAAGSAGSAGSDDTSELRTRKRTDAQIQADVERAADGLTYTSESDYPYTWVSAPLAARERTVTEALVREKLASYVDDDSGLDGPLRDLYGSERSFADFKSDYVGCKPDESPAPEDCAKTTKMLGVLEKNLSHLKVFYFGRDGSPGHVNGVAVSIFIVGVTPAGNLAGVRTVAIWT